MENQNTATAKVEAPKNTATVDIGGLIDEKQLQINKILASKQYILIAKTGESVIMGVPPEEIHGILAHVYSYMLMRAIESVTYAVVQNIAAQSAEDIAKAEQKAGEADAK